MNTRTVTHLLDEEWIIAIQEEIAAMPETLADTIEPSLLGQYDAERGLPCDPTKYYAELVDAEIYVVAYRDTVKLWADMVQAKNDAICAEHRTLITDATIDQAQAQAELDMERLEETEDYEQDILDREFWASGRW